MLTDFAWLFDRWPFLLRALWTTLYVSTLSLLLGFAIGILVGGLRSYGGRVLDLVLGFYVDSVRAIPPLALLVWTFFAFPILIGHSLGSITAGVLALGVHLGAYMAETIRAGLISVRPGQMRAALALGMTKLAAVRTIILPAPPSRHPGESRGPSRHGHDRGRGAPWIRCTTTLRASTGSA